MLVNLSKKLLNNASYFSTSIVNCKPCSIHPNLIEETKNYYDNIEVEKRIKEKKDHEHKMELIKAEVYFKEINNLKNNLENRKINLIIENKILEFNLKSIDMERILCHNRYLLAENVLNNRPITHNELLELEKHILHRICDLFYKSKIYSIEYTQFGEIEKHLLTLKSIQNLIEIYDNRFELFLQKKVNNINIDILKGYTP